MDIKIEYRDDIIYQNYGILYTRLSKSDGKKIMNFSKQNDISIKMNQFFSGVSCQALNFEIKKVISPAYDGWASNYELIYDGYLGSVIQLKGYQTFNEDKLEEMIQFTNNIKNYTQEKLNKFINILDELAEFLK